jgi:glutamyl-tRNA synthetase
MNRTRTRFAPSPTGYIHVGGIRTALFAWLVAKQAQGDFVLRLEDTDQAREVTGADAHIIKSLHTLGLEYDEGPDKQGEYGPYRQSERLEIYKKWAQKLISDGRAYADPYTVAEVQEFREQAKKNKQPFLYRNHRPANPPKWDGTTPLRFKSDPKNYTREDLVMGTLQTGPETIDDFVLIKTDGYPTYNFAHIVDDAEMKITHVIRGQEFLASIPNYLNLYEALNLSAPLMATMPHILGPDGKKKLSKRDGAKDVLDYVRDGYLVEALINFIASLGWNDGTTQEFFSVQELVQKFSLEKVQRSGARFDEQRLNWMNGAWIRSLSNNDLYMRCADFLPKDAANFDKTYKKRVIELVQERLKFFAELPSLTSFFFTEPEANIELIKSNKQLKKLDPQELRELLTVTYSTFEQSEFKDGEIQKVLNNLLNHTNQKPAVLFSLIRIVTTWAPASPHLAESLEVLGKETVLRRLENAIKIIP